MPLVEIIKGKNTSEETLAKAFDFVLQIEKTPIVVNNSAASLHPGLFGTFVNEGVALLTKGFSASSIENAAQLAGMPDGPLALCDEVSLNLITHIRDQTRQDTERESKTYTAHPAESVIDKMVTEFEQQWQSGRRGILRVPGIRQKVSVG